MSLLPFATGSLQELCFTNRFGVAFSVAEFKIWEHIVLDLFKCGCLHDIRWKHGRLGRLPWCLAIETAKCLQVPHIHPVQNETKIRHIATGNQHP